MKWWGVIGVVLTTYFSISGTSAILAMFIEEVQEFRLEYKSEIPSKMFWVILRPVLLFIGILLWMDASK